MNPRFEIGLNRLVKWLVVLGFFTLPYTHLKWMPNLGTTRPLSLVFFALAFGLLLIRQMAVNRFNLRAWWHWPKTWEGWPVLRWWLWLLGMGVISAAITPFYGLPVQALTRLMGYLAIFITLFFAAYSLAHYGIHSVARWIFLGYLPVLVYALVETAAYLNVAWALNFILWFRTEFIVSFHYSYRLSLMATEPSFIGFQLVLMYMLSAVCDRKMVEMVLRIINWADPDIYFKRHGLHTHDNLPRIVVIIFSSPEIFGPIDCSFSLNFSPADCFQ